MKRNTLISIIALVVSLVSVVITMQSSSQPDQAAIDLAAEKALQKREKQFVENHRDAIHAMMQGQDISLAKDWNPQNLEELFAPVIELINGLEE